MVSVSSYLASLTYARIDHPQPQKNEQARRQELEKEIKEKDAALARIRGERDNLIYRLEQKKASLPSQQVIYHHHHDVLPYCAASATARSP
jgi:molecular chaperone GrpE (heat shock protein)